MMKRKSAFFSGMLSKSGKWRQIYKNSVYAMFIFDVETKNIIEAKHAFFRIFKYDRKDLSQLSLYDIVVAERDEIEDNIQKTVALGMLNMDLRQYRAKDGEMMFVEVAGDAFISAGRKYIALKLRDVTEEQHIENRLRLAAQVFDSAIDGILVTDAEGVIQFANPSFLENTGYELSEILGMTPRVLKSGRQNELFYQSMWFSLNTTGKWQGEIWNRRKNGEVHLEWLIINAIKNELGAVTLYSAIYRDLTQRMKYEEQIRYYAYHDSLTGLPNRVSFYQQVKEILGLAREFQYKAAIMFLDLDGFKDVNDTYGHDVGDLLLKEVARRIRQAIGDEDMAARMGGDEFTIILARVEGANGAVQVAQRLQTSLNQPFFIDRHAISVSSSVGISIFPDHSIEEQVLITKADHAMYEAKNAGKNTYRLSKV